MTCLYTPYVSPIEKKLRDRLKAARARMEGQACRRDLALPPSAVSTIQAAPPVEPPRPEYRPWFRIVGLERPTVRDIQEIVAEFYGITRADILSKCRATKFTFPRQVAAYLAKEITGLSLPDIGRRFSGRDHTTILYSVNKVAALRESDPTLADEITEIKYRLEAL
jgi:hypothetical protein